MRKQYFPVPHQSAQLVLSQLSEHKTQQLVDLIPPGLFKERPGLLNHITLHISKPIRQTVYRIPDRLLLETMQSLGVIQPSSSECSSPVILVPKKDWCLRFCLDYRKVNSVSKVNSYPMPKED